MTTAPPRTLPAGLELVARRRLTVDRPEAWFALKPGDRPLVREGDTLAAGDALAERSSRGHTSIVRLPDEAAASLSPGERWPPPSTGASSEGSGESPAETSGKGPGGGSGRPRAARGPGPDGEALFAVGGRWRLAVPDRLETLEMPAAGTVSAVSPGRGIAVRLAGRALLGRTLVGEPARGQLELAAPARAGLRATAIDVGRAGAVLAAGAQVDAEAITRARAVGVRGIVVASLAASVRRDLVAAEGRRRAALHAHAAFGILVLDGTSRRPISSPAYAILSAVEGRDVALISDPPALIVDDPPPAFPEPPPDLVRVIGGPLTGREGRWLGLAPRRSRGVADPIVGLIDLGSDGRARISIGDLERFA